MSDEKALILDLIEKTPRWTPLEVLFMAEHIQKIRAKPSGDTT